MNVSQRYQIKGDGASAIAASVERAIMRGELVAGARLPSVRELAMKLRVSTVTVANAYNRLKLRGLVTADGRRGTVVSHGITVVTRAHVPIPSGVRNLADGGPDPALVPDWRVVLARLRYQPRTYGEPYNRPELLEMAARMFHDDGIGRGPVAIVSGAMDGLERALQAALRSGDRVALEDPAYHAALDLVRSLGLTPVAVAMDDCGMRPEALARALERGVNAVVVTPRAQNPTGAALDHPRAKELHRILRAHPDVILMEDDHAGPIAGTPALTLAEPGRERWAIIRSVSKWLGPDFRLAFMTGDEFTIGRVESRQHLGTGWVSHLLQQAVVEILRDKALETTISTAARIYETRRRALVDALHTQGIDARGRSGLNVWVPVTEEGTAIRSLLAAGWAVSAGERFRINTPPAIRVSVATLKPEEAKRLAADLAHAFAPSRLIGSA
ncbi:MAG: aminotransferase class I/II-fold pyridoxal phosphate-dependent enzyme [Candidatus Binataceae bacterium]